MVPAYQITTLTLASFMLADMYDRLTSNTIGLAVVGLILLLSVYVLAIKAVTGTRSAFGRRPPIDEDLAKHNATIEAIKKDLARLAPNEKLEELINRLGTFATLTQLAEVKLEFGRQVQDVRAFSHQEIHGIRGVLNEYNADAKLRNERLATVEAFSKSHHLELSGVRTLVEDVRKDIHDRINTMADRLGELAGEVRARFNGRTKT